MRFSLGALTVALAGSAVAHQPVKRAQSDDEPALIQAKDNSLIVPNRFIVEFESVRNMSTPRNTAHGSTTCVKAVSCPRC